MAENKMCNSQCDVVIRHDYRTDGLNAGQFQGRAPDSFTLAKIPAEKTDPWEIDWLFACTTAVESALLLAGKIAVGDKEGICSEYHALNAMYEMNAGKYPNSWGLSTKEFGYFGNRRYALAYLTRGDGAVTVLADPNESAIMGRLRKITDDKPQRYYVRNAVYIPDPYVFPDSTHQLVLKEHLTKYGAVTVLMYYDEQYLNGGNSYYCYDRQVEPSPELQEVIYHSVVILGWDDDYKKSNFKSTTLPKEDGAFFVRDCLGTNGQTRTFWVSYEDVEFGREAYCFQEISDDYYNQVRSIYQHDLFGFGDLYPSGTRLATSVSGRNVFKRSQPARNEELEAVGFYVASPCKCNFYLIQDHVETRLNGTSAIEYRMPGYYTYPLSAKHSLTKAEFEIRVEFLSLDGRSPVFVPLEKKDKRTVHLDLKAGESFIDSQDVTAVNASEKTNFGHVCIKAIVADKSDEATKVNEALLNFTLPPEEQGMWMNLPILDSNGVSYDWSRLEPSSEGTASTFRYHSLHSKSESKDYGLWMNTESLSRRIVLTLFFKIGGLVLKKLIKTSLSVQVIPVILLVKVAKYGTGSPCYCISGNFPVLGAKVKISSQSKANPRIVVTVDPASYPEVAKGAAGKGEWTCSEFDLVKAADYDVNDKDHLYCVQAVFLDESGNNIVSSGIQEQKVELPYTTVGTNEYEVDSWFGLVVALATFFGFLFGIVVGIKCPIVVPPPLPGGGGPGIPDVGENTTLNGRNNTITRAPGQAAAFGEVRGNIVGVIVSGVLGAAAGFVVGMMAKKVWKSGYIKNSLVNIQFAKGCSSKLEVGGIAIENNGTIENCRVMFSSPQPVKSVGGVAGKNTKDGVITGCSVMGDFQGETAGGIALGSEGRIRNCTVKSNITGSLAVGGICAEVSGGDLQNNAFSGQVSAGVCGGIAGKLTDGSIRVCQMEGKVKGTASAGGVCAEVKNGTLESATFSGDVQGTVCGGIAGKQTGGKINDCKADGNVTGATVAGGIGSEVSGAVVLRNVFSGQISAGLCGGIAGRLLNSGEVRECAAAVGLTSQAGTGGGIVGKLENGSILDCYSTGTVDCKIGAGGVAGEIMTGTSLERCYSIVTVGMSGIGNLAGGIAGSSADGCIKNSVAANPYVAATGEIYRIAKGKPGDGSTAMAEMQTVAGKTFPDMGENLLSITALCKQSVFAGLGWDCIGTWNMDDVKQFPKLSRVPENPSFRHPFIVIENTMTGDHYCFKYGDLVKFSGYKNPIVKKLKVSLEIIFNQTNTLAEVQDRQSLVADDSGSEGNADTNHWEQEIGWLEKGNYLLTFQMSGDNFNTEFPAKFTVE